VIGYTNCLAVTSYSQSLMNQIGQLRWYFAHASVGIYIMDGIADLHAMNPTFYQIQSAAEDGTPPSTTTNGIIYEYMRGNPGWQAKVDTFATYVGNGWRSPKVNLAVNKFCWIDPDANLSYYLNSMTNLEAASPATVFVYTTVPLTTIAYNDPADSYLRNVFNDGLRAWVRANSRVLYDIADIEAHDTNGVLCTFTYNNRVCQCLYPGYNASGDGGHPDSPYAYRLLASGLYALAAATTGPLTVTVTGITASNKVYNGTTSATLQTNSAALAGVQGGDQVTLILTNAAGAFDTKAVGIGKTVRVSGLQIVGRDAGKYTLTEPTTTAAITAATLTVSGITANNKAYDGMAAAAIQTSGATLLGKVNGDDVTLNTGGASGVFLDANVGIGKPVTVSGLTISGADSGNYSLLQPAGISANIGVASLIVRADDKQRLYGETNPVFTASYSGFVNGQTFGTSGVIGNPSLSTTAVTGSLPGIYPIIIAVGSLSAVNYSFNVVNGTLTVTGSVAPFPISSVSLSNGVALVSWAAVGGQTYRLQFEETLADSIWHDVVPDVAATGLPGGNTVAMAQDVVGDASHRFYRVMLVK
jgi:hypothetical protein